MGANIVLECFVYDQGCEPNSRLAADRIPYQAWCEAKVSQWQAACAEFGYDRPTWEIRTLSGALTYHEWLKREVGL